jgi:hypothetical protein
MPVQEEQYESIPWSHLVEQARPQPWLTYVASAAVVAGVIGVVIARSSPPALPEPEPVLTVTSSTTSTTALPSEQDLMADPIADGGARAAVMRAEWFVRDYFTIDGAGGRTEEVTAALGWSPPAVNEAITTYVEWARAWTVEQRDTGRYRVSVAYRSITAGEDGFGRGLPRAVAVHVEVGESGGTRVLDLPQPIELPPSPEVLYPPGAGDLPEPVADLALDQASAWGDPLAVSEGAKTGTGWRVVVMIADDVGTPWPMMVQVEENTRDG